MELGTLFKIITKQREDGTEEMILTDMEDRPFTLEQLLVIAFKTLQDQKGLFGGF